MSDHWSNPEAQERIVALEAENRRLREALAIIRQEIDLPLSWSGHETPEERTLVQGNLHRIRAVFDLAVEKIGQKIGQPPYSDDLVSILKEASAQLHWSAEVYDNIPVEHAMAARRIRARIDTAIRWANWIDTHSPRP